jgi:hypothetical protein
MSKGFFAAMSGTVVAHADVKQTTAAAATVLKMLRNIPSD